MSTAILLTLYYTLLVLIFCVTPAGVLWLCRKYTILGKIGPIMILYALGIIIGNIPINPDDIFGVPAEKVVNGESVSILASFKEMFSSALVPLAIPMMLFGCTFNRNELSLQIRLLISGVISVCLATVGGYLLFGQELHDGAQIGGMIAGKCTGGTLNMAAIQQMLHMDKETYIMLNTYDMIICFVYFVFLFSVGIKMFRRLYRQGKSTMTEEEQAEIQREIEESKRNPYENIFSPQGLREIGKTLLATVIILVISAGVAIALSPKGWFSVVFILMLTTLGIAGTFIKRVRNLTRSYDIGMYLIYIFSMVIASMADLSRLQLAEGINQFAFIAFAIFVSLAIHALLCRLFKVDADSMVISSVAFINSPPFVPMVSAFMRNKKTLVTGLSLGLIGYAIGNYLGFIMAELLAKL